MPKHSIKSNTSLLAILVLVLSTVIGVVGAASSPAAAFNPTYHVLTDVGHRVAPTTAPDGTYGIPNGAAFVVECQIIGQPFPNGNALYFRTTYGNETPTYVPDYYTDSPHLGTQPPIAGIPMCGSTPTPTPTPTPGGASVYYSGLGDAGWAQAQPYASVSLTDNGTHNTNDWTTGPRCSTAGATSFPTSIGGRTVTTAAGWSLGRLGPIYLLKQSATYASNIHYILMFDPASYTTMSSSCDATIGASAALASWLSSNPGNRLVIMAGYETADYRHPVNGYAHAGIQNYYFPSIRGRAIANQVLVCNVETNGVPWSHQDTYTNYAWMISQPPPSTCPSNFLGWHP